MVAYNVPSTLCSIHSLAQKIRISSSASSPRRVEALCLLEVFVHVSFEPW